LGQAIFTFQRLQDLKAPVSNEGKQLARIACAKKNSVTCLKCGRKLLSSVVGKIFGPKKEEVTLAWRKGHTNHRQWDGRGMLRGTGEDRNVYRSHAETCGWKWRLVVVSPIGGTGPSGSIRARNFLFSRRSIRSSRKAVAFGVSYIIWSRGVIILIAQMETFSSMEEDVSSRLRICIPPWNEFPISHGYLLEPSTCMILMLVHVGFRSCVVSVLWSVLLRGCVSKLRLIHELFNTRSLRNLYHSFGIKTRVDGEELPLYVYFY
jgi:hypothetical protein